MIKRIKDWFLKLIALPALFILFNAAESFSQQDYTDYIISGGAYAGANIYLSDFTQLPGYPSSSPGYDNALGFGYGLFGEFRYIPSFQLFGMKTRIGFRLSYRNLSADYAIEDPYANIITGNDYQKAVTEHWLAADISEIGLSPQISVTPMESFPLQVSLGAELGYLLNSTFEQQERILSPDFITYIDGKTTRNESSGDIPGASSIYAGAVLGFAYPAVQFGNFRIYPELEFLYGLTSIAENTGWNSHGINAGFSIRYRIPEPELVPPMAPPLPDLPNPAPPPPPDTIRVALDVYHEDDGLLENNDTVPVKIYETVNYEVENLIPAFFFRENSAEFMPGRDHFGFRYDPSWISAAMKNSTREKESLNYSLNAYALDYESDDVIARRIEKIKDMTGIPEEISAKIIKTDTSKLAHSDLASDYRRIEIFINGKLPIINDTVNAKTVAVRPEESVSFKIITDIDANIDDYNFESGIFINNVKISGFDQPESRKSIDLSRQEIFYDTKFETAELLFKAAAGNRNVSDSATQKLYLQKNIIVEKTYTNLEETGTDAAEELLAALFPFDSSEPMLVNEQTLAAVKEAVSGGAKLRIFGYTDKFGEEEYNERLARKRAEAIANILKLSPDNYEIIIPGESKYPNDIPYLRIFNRSVYIKILRDIQ